MFRTLYGAEDFWPQHLLITFQVAATYALYLQNPSSYGMLDNRTLNTIIGSAACFYICIKYIFINYPRPFEAGVLHLPAGCSDLWYLSVIRHGNCPVHPRLLCTARVHAPSSRHGSVGVVDLYRLCIYHCGAEAVSSPCGNRYNSFQMEKWHGRNHTAAPGN